MSGGSSAANVDPRLAAQTMRALAADCEQIARDRGLPPLARAATTIDDETRDAIDGKDTGKPKN